MVDTNLFEIMKHSSFITASALALALSSIVAQAAPPTWWSTSPAIVSGTPNHKGPASIGQAKNFARKAIDRLALVNPTVAASIEAQLTQPQGALAPILSFTVPASPTAAWQRSQKAPLQIGQLKAITAPFYNALNTLNATWLTSQRSQNGTQDAANAANIYPWTAVTTDDANKNIATTGQLKAAFSLRFEAL
jgi:hypothetical protein